MVQSPAELAARQPGVSDVSSPYVGLRSGRTVPPAGVLQVAYQLGRLGEALRCGEKILQYLNELLADDSHLSDIERAVAPVDEFKTKRFGSIFDMRLYRILLYAVVREAKPRVAIETGVLHGLTTSFLLRALEKNGGGKLISIDLPSYPDSGPSNSDGYNAVLPPGKEPGWVVDTTRHAQRWDLRLEASTEVLQSLGREADQLGFFLHDSDHTFETMWFEMEWAWDRLVDRGVLVCDNIEASTAFIEFARRVGRDMLVFPAPDSRVHNAPRFGLLVK